MHPISEPAAMGKGQPGTNRFSHGLGVGDLNGDKRLDVITSQGGWWEQPEKADGKTPWKFHPASTLNEACADLHAFDVDGDGIADVLGTSAHKFGIWWFKQRPTSTSSSPATFEKKEIFKELISETHAAHFQDIDGDGIPDLITGKRKYSHGRSEPGSENKATIYWLKVGRGKDGIATFTPHVIDEDSGIGTQFVVADMNGDGLLDVIGSNKNGVHVVIQQRK
jgi:hypothetical protein